MGHKPHSASSGTGERCYHAKHALSISLPARSKTCKARCWRSRSCRRGHWGDSPSQVTGQRLLQTFRTTHRHTFHGPIYAWHTLITGPQKLRFQKWPVALLPVRLLSACRHKAFQPRSIKESVRIADVLLSERGWQVRGRIPTSSGFRTTKSAPVFGQKSTGPPSKPTSPWWKGWLRSQSQREMRFGTFCKCELHPAPPRTHGGPQGPEKRQ